MLLLATISFLILQSNAAYTHLRAHFSDSLKVKCDALPYRSAFIGTQCFFADSREVSREDASAQCSVIFQGSKIASKVPAEVFQAMMIEASNYHTSDSSGAKRTICVYDSGYKCAEGESTIIQGKCLVRSDKKKTFPEAKKHCNSLGMEFPSLENELENQILTGIVGKDTVWVDNTFDKVVWKNDKTFARYGTCDRSTVKPPLYTGAQNQLWKCNTLVAAVLDGSSYWYNSEQNELRDIICIESATNDFVFVKNITKGTSVVEKVACVAMHVWNESTKRCEWTGPDNSCAMLVNHANTTCFSLLPNFPRQVYVENEISRSGNPVCRAQNDNTVKVVVRRGCMWTPYQSAVARGVFGSDDPKGWWQEAVLVKNGQKFENLIYGEHRVPSARFGDLADNDNGACGVSRDRCFCDVAEATLNGHKPSPPADKKCIEHHTFNEDTQQCEWQLDSKYCGELMTYDGRRMLLEIPNWPIERKYDVMHKGTDKPDFNVAVTNIIVRQHCFATLYNGKKINSGRTLETIGYGNHKVVSYHNGLSKTPGYGTDRVVCECAGPQEKLTTATIKEVEEKLDKQGLEQPCTALHKWDEATGKCEWTGPKDACLQLIDFQNKTWYMSMPNFPKQVQLQIDIARSRNPQNDRTTKIIVRRGCMATAYRASLGGVNDNEQNQELVLYPIDNVNYGEHRVPSWFNGDIMGNTAHGLSRINCFCDASEATVNGHVPAPPPDRKCIEHHVFNEATQTCEWTLERKYCGELISHDGRRMLIEIDGWPLRRKYDVMHKRTGNENFHETVTSIIVRQHCFATMYSAKAINSALTLPTSGYGLHQVISYHNGLSKTPGYGTDRIQCECIR